MQHPQRPAGQGAALGCAAALLLLCAGCSTRMDIRPLATGRVDVAAYELSGSDLAALRREAGLLCPQGADVLRQAGREQRNEQSGGWARRWVDAGTERLDPPQRSAQLVVLCREAPADLQVQAALPAAPADLQVQAALPAAPAAAASAAAAVTELAASPPVGPVSVEW